jgi:hypothetical protein
LASGTSETVMADWIMERLTEGEPPICADRR